MILISCVIKDCDKLYPQLFSEETLYDEETQHKAVEKDISNELMSVAWHPLRW